MIVLPNNDPESGSLIPGWYGKIPALGDFTSRRLPRSFIDAWDPWLQHAMAASRAQLEERWLDLYLTGPIWRFALMPGVCGNNMWAGVLMSSVDKVGRYFPLTIAVQIEPHPEAIILVFSAQGWYTALEQTALATLNLNAAPEDLEQGLIENPFPAAQVNGQQSSAQELATWWPIEGSGPKTFNLLTSNSLADLFETSAWGMLATLGFGKSIWWAESETGPTQLHCFSGLPAEDHYAVLLQGFSAR